MRTPTRRALRHVALALAGAGVTVTIGHASDFADPIARWSIGTAYASLWLLAWALALGPFYLLVRGRRPASTYLRRDVGIWAGILAVVHVVLGLQVHFRGRIWAYFLDPVRAGWMPRLDAFGVANWIGLAAAILMMLLLAISNDRSIRALGIERWRRFQSVATWAGALVVAHGAAYQLLERRSVVFVLVASSFVVFAAAIRMRMHVRSGRRSAASDRPTS